MKNQAYLAKSPMPAGMKKMAASVTAQPTYPQSIQGRARPILLLVLSIMAPKKISVTPSKSLDTAISVPTMPELSPTVLVRKIIRNELSRAYTTLPAISPEP